MCRYTSTVYGGCGHAEHYLVEFCQNADFGNNTLAAAAALPPTNRPPEGTPAPPSHPPPSQQQASLPYRLESIAEDKEEETDKMPGLGPFAAGLRQWMGSQSGDSTPLSTSTVTPTSSHAREREEGLRGTDESGNIHNSDSILQHITDSARGFEGGHADTESNAARPYGSGPESEADETKSEELEAIAAEIKNLKTEVQHMRTGSQERTRGKGKETHTTSRLPQPVGKSSATLPAADYPVLGVPKKPAGAWLALQESPPPPPPSRDEKHENQPPMMSPAQLLQHRHQQEAFEEANRKPPPIRMQSPPKARDFPELATSKASSVASAAPVLGVPQLAANKQSYARAAGQSLKKAKPVLTLRTAGLQVGPAKAQDIPSPDSPQSPDKPSPRFAQATKATIRRADETLRKDSPPVKPSPEGSPTKAGAVKGPSFETEKRIAQRAQKRTSLPTGWMATPEQTSSPAEKKDDQDQVTMPLRKKTSSYMAPTKSTKQRESSTRHNYRNVATGAGPNVDPSVAVRDFATHPLSPDGSLIGTDDVFFTAPNSRQGSESPEKKGTKSPKKSRLNTPGQVKSPLKEPLRPGLGDVALPAPRRQVQNTAGQRPASRDTLLGPIVRRLMDQQLFKGQPVPQPSAEYIARRAERKEYKRPASKQEKRAPGGLHNVFLDEAVQRARRGSAASSASGYVPASSMPLAPVLRERPGSRNADAVNNPISSIISGLRGRSSRDIGKALLSPPADGEASRRTSFAFSRSAPADPAILYQGNMPAGGVAPPQLDPAIIFSGSMKDARPAAADVPRERQALRLTSSSLRATAQEFKPSWQAAPAEPGSSGPAYVNPRTTEADWNSMNIETQANILEQRWKQEDAADKAFLKHLETISKSGLPKRRDSAVFSWFGEAERLTKLAGEAVVSPTETSTDTPVISPHSSDTSPPASQGTQRSSNDHWKITAESHRNRPYTWTGGDGKEICYDGYGPDAERDPNSPVSYRKNKTHTFHRQAGRFFGNVSSDGVDESPGKPPPDAPRKMREWAERQGYAAVPCQTIDVGNMIEALPFSNADAGFCANCKSERGGMAGFVGGVVAPVQ